MTDAKNVLAVAISLVILAFVVESVPTIKSNLEDVFGGISISSMTKAAPSSSFPVKLDAGLLMPSFTIQMDNVETIAANSKNASIVFDDRRISINPSLLQDMGIESYSGKLTYDSTTKYVGFDGAAKGFVSSAATIRSERRVKMLGNLTYVTTKLTNVAGGSITISKASGSLVYNTTNTLSLLGDDVRISKFNGEITIGSYGIIMDGSAGRVEVNGAGKTISYG